MKVPGVLLLTGVFLFGFSDRVPLRGDGYTWFTYLTLACLAGGLFVGLVRGPAAVRLAVALFATSTFLYVKARTEVPLIIGGPGMDFNQMNPTYGVPAAIFLALSVIAAIRALRDEAAPRVTANRSGTR
jgi:hypothetical protein